MVKRERVEQESKEKTRALVGGPSCDQRCQTALLCSNTIGGDTLSRLLFSKESWSLYASPIWEYVLCLQYIGVSL